MNGNVAPGLVLTVALAMPAAAQTLKCTPAAPTQTITVMTQQLIGASRGFNLGPSLVDGCRFINIYVQYRDSVSPPSPPPGGTPSVSLGVAFALSGRQEMQSRMYVNLESNIPSLQPVSLVDVSPKGPFVSTQGQNLLGKEANYVVRAPVMGPWVTVFAYYDASVPRYVWIKIYATY